MPEGKRIKFHCIECGKKGEVILPVGWLVGFKTHNCKPKKRTKND